MLIAQITVLGAPLGFLPYEGTITLFTSGGNPDGVKVDFVPGPSAALALLGGMVVATRRRRR